MSEVVAEAAVLVLREELLALTEAAEAYMRYHAEKFYEGVEPKPTGLWPAIEKARHVIANFAEVRSETERIIREQAIREYALDMLEKRGGA